MIAKRLIKYDCILIVGLWKNKPNIIRDSIWPRDGAQNSLPQRIVAIKDHRWWEKSGSRVIRYIFALALGQLFFSIIPSPPC